MQKGIISRADLILALADSPPEQYDAIAEVIQHESQMLFLIVQMGLGSKPEPVAEPSA